MPVRAAAVLIALGAAACGRFGFEHLDPQDIEDCADVPNPLVCSGFEGDFDSYWMSETEGAARFDEPCPGARSGTGCLVAHSLEGGAAARAYRMYEPQPTGTLHLRFYAYLDGASQIDGINLATLDALDSGVYGPDVNVRGDSLEIYLEEEPGISVSIGVVPRDRWFCIELGVVVGDGDGSVSLAFDGNAPTTIGGIDTYPNAPYDYAAFGLDWSSDDQEPIAVRVDDVIVATTPLPCP